MKQLELKHIAPYLPYNLKYVAKQDSGILDDTWADAAIDNGNPFSQALQAGNKKAFELLKSPITIDLHLGYEDKDLHLGSGEFSLGYPIDDIFANEVKPLLRPMSDLFENIVHNGEIVCVAKVIGDLGDYQYETINGCIYNMEYSEQPLLDFEDPSMRKEIPYEVVEILFKYHFDFFDLLKKGLAEPIKQQQ